MIPIVTSGENVYIQIHSSTGSVLMQVPVTSACQHIQQLSQSDYIKLSWISDTGSLLPAGAYVVGDDEEHYVLLNPYSPTMTDEATYKYEPQFTSRFFSLAKVPFFMYTYDSSGAITLREPDWSLTDNAGNFMQALCDGIYNETRLRYGYAIGSDITVGSATVTFNATDIISAANAIANAFGTEVWLEKTASGSSIGIIHLSKARLNAETAPELIVGTNVGVPTVKDNGAFYNRFYAFGSSRNITQDYMGSGVNNLATKRLTLNPAPDQYPDGYMDFSGGSNIQSIVLQFDDIYPSATNLVLYDVRPRMRYRLDDNGKKIQIGTDEHGDPVYDSYAIWYAQLKQKDGSTYKDFVFNDSTYDAEDNPNGMMIAGLVPSFHFNSGALTGREFDVIYHKTAQTVQDNADYGSFQIKAGDFEIVYTQEGNLIIPTTVGLIPDDDNLVVLFNVRMPNDYILDAQERLKQALIKEINDKYIKVDSNGHPILIDGQVQPVDRKEYTVKSYSDIFNSTGISLTVGAAVTFTVGTTSFETRVTSLTKQIDFPDEQSITVGNEVIKGALETLQESAQSANQNINILAAVNQASKSIIDSYNRTQQVLIEGLAAIGNMWLVQPDNSIKLNPDFIGVWTEGFVSAFRQSDTGGGGGGGIDLSAMWTNLQINESGVTGYGLQIDYHHLPTIAYNGDSGFVTSAAWSKTGSTNYLTLTRRALTASDIPSLTTSKISDLETWINGKDFLTGNETITLSGVVSGSGTTAITTSIADGKITNAMLAGSIANGKLANSAITINGTSTSLGGSFATASITAGTAGTSSATSGLSIAIPYVTLNQYGIVTAYGTHTHSISKANITSAIGSTTYAPYNSAGYLPLSGGTMTGDIKMTAGKYLTTADGATIIGVTTQGVFYIGDPQAEWSTNIAGEGDLLHDTGGSLAVILDQENFDTYALPLAGGVMTGPISGVTYLSVNRAAQTTYRLDVNGASRLAGNTSITGTLGVTGATTLANLTVGSSNSITLGDGVLTWDAQNSAWKLTGNLYATGFISAFGASDTGGGGGGINLNAMWANLQVNDSDTTGYNLQIDPGHLTTALGTYVNAITTTGSGNAITAVSKSGSTLTFTKGSTFALASRTVTGTGYLTGGGALSANRTIDIASTYKGYIDEGHTAYGWGDHAQAGYLTGITSSMVTTALGFTPANSTALGNYLPLAGGTMTADAAISWGTNDRTDWDTIPNGIRILSSTDTTSGAPTQYAVGMTIRSRYSFSLASRGGTADSFYFKSGARNWYEVYHSGNLTQSVVTGLIGSSTYAPYNADGYLPLSGGTMSGNIIFDGNSPVIKFDVDTSRARQGLNWLNTAGNVVGSILMHNTAKSIYINATGASAVYSDTVGKYSLKIGENSLTYNTYNIWHAGNANLSTVNWVCKLLTANSGMIAGGSTSGAYIGSASGGLGSTYTGGLILAYGKNPLYFYTNSGNRMMITGGGNVGIGTTSPAYKLDVTGVIRATTGIFSNGYVSAFGQSTTSDARLKKDFLDTTLTVDDIAHAPAITFLWKDREGKRQAGSLAQYWETVLPEVVTDIEGKKGLDYGAAALVSAITIARDVNDHEKRIRELERENRELKRRLGYADR